MDRKALQMQRAWKTRAEAIEADDAALAEYLQKTGGWNRIEGTVGGEKLSISLNGQEILSKQFSSPKAVLAAINRTVAPMVAAKTT